MSLRLRLPGRNLNPGVPAGSRCHSDSITQGPEGPATRKAMDEAGENGDSESREPGPVPGTDMSFVNSYLRDEVPYNLRYEDEQSIYFQM